MQNTVLTLMNNRLDKDFRQQNSTFLTNNGVKQSQTLYARMIGCRSEYIGQLVEPSRPLARIIPLRAEKWA